MYACAASALLKKAPCGVLVAGVKHSERHQPVAAA